MFKDLQEGILELFADGQRRGSAAERAAKARDGRRARERDRKRLLECIPGERKSIACSNAGRIGGRAAHAKGILHRFTPEECRRGAATGAAGRSVQLKGDAYKLTREDSIAGGRTAHAKGVLHRFTPEESRRGGRKGGARIRAALGDDGWRDLARRAARARWDRRGAS